MFTLFLWGNFAATLHKVSAAPVGRCENALLLWWSLWRGPTHRVQSGQGRNRPECVFTTSRINTIWSTFYLVSFTRFLLIATHRLQHIGASKKVCWFVTSLPALWAVLLSFLLFCRTGFLTKQIMFQSGFCRKVSFSDCSGKALLNSASLHKAFLSKTLTSPFAWKWGRI